MNRILLLLVAASYLLAGCSTNPATVQAVLDAQSKARPTLAVTCPAGGCSVEYTDPRDRGVRLPTNGWDATIAVSNNITGLVSGAVPYAAIGAVAVHGLRAVERAGQGGNVTTNTSTATTNTASGAGSSTGGSGNYEQIGPDSNNSQATTTTTTTDNSIDNTATPTVVTQPAPLVVMQPAPVVVPAVGVQ